MPRKAAFVCSRCRRAVPAGQRCACRKDERAPASQRGYGTDWRKLRADLMPAGTPCRLCGQPAKHLDHIVPRAAGGSDEPSNLQPLCASCHSAKTAAADGGFGNARRTGEAGYVPKIKGCDASGRPLDPDHPWNRGK